MKKLLLLAALVAPFALGERSRAQDHPAPEGTAPVGSDAAPVGSGAPSRLDRLLVNDRLVAEPSRDPFSDAKNIQLRALEGREDRLNPGRGVAIPKLALRGYVEPRGKPPVALIDIAGQGCYPVRKDDTIGLTAQGRTLVLRVLSVEATGVRIETGTLGQVIVVR